MSDVHELHWCYRCFKHVAVRALDNEFLCCECNNGFVCLYSRGDSNLESLINRLSAMYNLGPIPNTLEGDNGNGARRGAPPAAKSAIEALETFEVGSTTSEEGERMDVLCAVCRDAMVIGEKGKKLPCGHCYHDNCILPWLETRNSCPVCRFQLRTDDPHYERKRAREEPPLTAFAGASSSSSVSGREDNNNHHVVETRRRSTRRKRKPNRYIAHG